MTRPTPAQVLREGRRRAAAVTSSYGEGVEEEDEDEDAAAARPRRRRRGGGEAADAAGVSPADIDALRRRLRNIDTAEAGYMMAGVEAAVKAAAKEAAPPAARRRMPPPIPLPPTTTRSGREEEARSGVRRLPGARARVRAAQALHEARASGGPRGDRRRVAHRPRGLGRTAPVADERGARAVLEPTRSRRPRRGRVRRGCGLPTGEGGLAHEAARAAQLAHHRLLDVRARPPALAADQGRALLRVGRHARRRPLLTGAPPAYLMGGSGEISTVALSPDGRFAAVGSGGDAPTCVYDLQGPVRDGGGGPAERGAAHAAARPRGRRAEPRLPRQRGARVARLADCTLASTRSRRASRCTRSETPPDMNALAVSDDGMELTAAGKGGLFTWRFAAQSTGGGARARCSCRCRRGLHPPPRRRPRREGGDADHEPRDPLACAHARGRRERPPHAVGARGQQRRRPSRRSTSRPPSARLTCCTRRRSSPRRPTASRARG